MCGICGIINFNQKPVDENQIKIMMRMMKHRGPDDEGIFIEGNVGLGFVRLSIIDLSPLGHQPMISGDKVTSNKVTGNGQYVIVYNGEVYNYIEIREKLRAKGYKFRSNTDTEVVLNSFIEWGEDCLNRFNGMWALVIFDKKNKKLFCARDRFGIKPFYYFKDNEQFIFASEITPILEIKPATKKANDQIIFDYLLTNRTNHTDNTFFKDIKKIQHGHIININIKEGSVNSCKWYSLSNKSIEGYKSSDEFKQDFITAINLQLRSDVPIGLSLSGGLDSSSIGATISKIIGRSDIHSFSAVYGKGQRGDESEFISEFDGYIDNIHFTYPSIDSFMMEMDSFISILGEPVADTSIYAEYKVMELSKKHCAVVLNGQGVDEFLAGYHDLIGVFLKQRFLELSWGTLIHEILKYNKIHKSYYPLFSAIFFSLSPRLKELLFFKKNEYISQDFFSEYSKQNENSLINNLYDSKTLKESFISHFEYKFEHHLLYADKTGMQFSLETRFPFLDHNIVEKTLNTNTDFIYKNGVTKVILRHAMKGILPEKVRNRMDKVGYETPEDDWFRNKRFQGYFLDIINSTQFKNRPYFNVSKVNNLNTQHITGRKDNGKEIWKILHLEIWLRKFIDCSFQ